MRRGFRSEPQIGVVFSLSLYLFLSLSSAVTNADVAMLHEAYSRIMR